MMEKRINQNYLPYEIMRKVAEHDGIPVAMMLKNDRHKRCKEARQKSMYFLYILTRLNPEGIGRNFEGKFGTKDRCTVIHALKTVNNLIETDKMFRNDINELREIFGLIPPSSETRQLEYLESYNSNAETYMPKLKIQPKKVMVPELSQESDRVASSYYLEALKHTKKSCIKAFGEINF
jgi:hypothetical protein